MRSSVYGWRCPRMRSQPSSCVRKCQSLRCLPCETTSASTRAPETTGAPSLTSAPSPTRSTSSSSFTPTSCASFSTLSRSPSLTRYCLPPVLTTAYIEDLLAFRLGTGPAGREIPPRGAERNGRSSGSGLPSQVRPGPGRSGGPGDVLPDVDQRRVRRLHHVHVDARPGGVA